MSKLLSKVRSRFNDESRPAYNWKAAFHRLYKKIIRPADLLFLLAGITFIGFVAFEGYWFARAIKSLLFSPTDKKILHFSFLTFIVWGMSIFSLSAATMAWFFNILKRTLNLLRLDRIRKTGIKSQWILLFLGVVLQLYVIVISPPWLGIHLQKGTDIFDVTVYHWLNHHAGHFPLLDHIMSFFAQYALEIYAVMFIIAWFTLPKRDSKGRHALVVSVMAGIFALAINFVIAHIWFRPRPFTVLPQGDFIQLIPHGNDASFPSDHTSGSFAFAASSWGRAPKWLQISFTGLALIVMVARVYVGVHWPTDVIAGLIVGTLSGRLIWKLDFFIFPLTKIGLRLFQFGNYSNKHRHTK